MALLLCISNSANIKSVPYSCAQVGWWYNLFKGGFCFVLFFTFDNYPWLIAIIDRLNSPMVNTIKILVTRDCI